MRAILLTITGLLLTAAISPDPAFAQRRRTYVPSTPALSPYLRLFDRNRGSIADRLIDTRRLQSQIQNVRSVQGQLGRLERNQGFRGSASSETGGHGGFMYHSHYYPSLSRRR